MRNVATLMTGTGLAQLIPILASPLLTRLYGPESFGTLAVFLGCMTVVVVFISGRYELAIVVPQKMRDAASLFVLAAAIAIFIALIMLISILMYFIFLNESLFQLDNSFKLVILLVPISALMVAVNQCAYYWCNRYKDYRSIALNKITHSIVIVGVQVGFGIYVESGLGLIVGYLSGQLVSMIILVAIIWNSHSNEFRQVRFIDITRVARRYIDFPKFLIFSHSISKIAAQAPAISFNGLFGAAPAGYYMLAQRAVGSPMTILSSAIGDIFRQQASSEYSKVGSCEGVFTKAFLRLVLLSILPFSVLYLFAPDIFEIVFGKEWREVGGYIRVLAPMYMIRFVVSPLSSMFMIAEAQKIDVVFTSCLLIFVILSIATGFYEGNIILSLSAYSVSYSFFYLASGYYSYKLALGKNHGT
ncbi:lipopolysaccharide biosynthesis protein [Zhongshania sp.]|uniref:lipopolysaccharide biosynthesis protein n=1 Tax=Zhongshania sp. TaxID=1971902 RepID=UPI0039E43FEF